MVLSFQLDREKEQVNNQLERNISLKLSDNGILLHIQPVVLVMVHHDTSSLLLTRYVGFPSPAHSLLQMASVWEERFKEEAEKTIPLQEVDLEDIYC